MLKKYLFIDRMKDKEQAFDLEVFAINLEQARIEARKLSQDDDSILLLISWDS